MGRSQAPHVSLLPCGSKILRQQRAASRLEKSVTLLKSEICIRHPAVAPLGSLGGHENSANGIDKTFLPDASLLQELKPNLYPPLSTCRRSFLPMKYEPFHSAYEKIVAQCWADEDFKERFLVDPAAIFAQEGVEVPAGLRIHAVEDTADTRTLVVPAQPKNLEASEVETIGGGFLCGPFFLSSQCAGPFGNPPPSQ